MEITANVSIESMVEGLIDGIDSMTDDGVFDEYDTTVINMTIGALLIFSTMMGFDFGIDRDGQIEDDYDDNEESICP